MWTFYKRFKKLVKRLPRRALSNFDIIQYVKETRIPYFRGVFMKDDLPKICNDVECGVVNLDESVNEGTHWVAYVKLGNYCEYFDSFGDLKPPLELIKYLKCEDLFYNYNKYQSFDTVNCGHLCLAFLKQFWNIKRV